MFAKVKDFFLINSGASQTIAKNAFWLGVSNIGGRLIRVIIIVYAARVLGVAEWGAFSYGIAVVAFLTILADFGINTVVTRETSRDRNSPDWITTLATAFRIKLILLSLVVILTVILAPYLTKIESARAVLPILALVLAMDALRDFGFSLIRADEKMEKEAFLFIITNLAIVGFGFLALSFSQTARSFAWAYAAGGATGTIATAILLRRYWPILLSGWQKSRIKNLFTSAWPFALSSLLGGLMVNTDVVILGWIKTAEDVGHYSSAQRIILLLYIIPGILASSIFPIMSRLARKDDLKAGRILSTAINSVCLISIPIMLGGFILADNIIGFFFGAEYLPGTIALKILLLTLAANFCGFVLVNTAFAYREQKSLIIYSALGGIVNIILDLALIPKWGIAGCALATLLVQVVTTTYIWWAMKKNVSFSVSKNLPKMVLASVIMGTATFFMKSWLFPVIPTILASGAIYFIALWILREPILIELKTLFLGAKAQTDL